MSRAKKLAEEIIMVLKYNPQLSDNDKMLAVETRLDYLIRDVETACAESHKRSQDNAVIIDNRPQDIPELRDILLQNQGHRGPLN